MFVTKDVIELDQPLGNTTPKIEFGWLVDPAQPLGVLQPTALCVSLTPPKNLNRDPPNREQRVDSGVMGVMVSALAGWV